MDDLRFYELLTVFQSYHDDSRVKMKGFWQWNSVASAGCMIYIAERITLDTALGQKNGHGDRVVVWHISYGNVYLLYLLNLLPYPMSTV